MTVNKSIILQPNNLFCIFCADTNTVVHFNLSEEAAIEILLEDYRAYLRYLISIKRNRLSVVDPIPETYGDMLKRITAKKGVVDALRVKRDVEKINY